MLASVLPYNKSIHPHVTALLMVVLLPMPLCRASHMLAACSSWDANRTKPYTTCAGICGAGPDVQELLASSEAMVSQGARQALAAAAVAASAELAAMRSTLQVLSSHLDALHAGHTLPPGQGKTCLRLLGALMCRHLFVVAQEYPQKGSA